MEWDTKLYELSLLNKSKFHDPTYFSFQCTPEPSKCMGFVIPWSRPLLQLFVYLRSAYEDGMVKVISW